MSGAQTGLGPVEVTEGRRSPSVRRHAPGRPPNGTSGLPPDDRGARHGLTRTSSRGWSARKHCLAPRTVGTTARLPRRPAAPSTVAVHDAEVVLPEGVSLLGGAPIPPGRLVIVLVDAAAPVVREAEFHLPAGVALLDRSPVPGHRHTVVALDATHQPPGRRRAGETRSGARGSRGPGPRGRGGDAAGRPVVSYACRPALDWSARRLVTRRMRRSDLAVRVPLLLLPVSDSRARIPGHPYPASQIRLLPLLR